MVIILNYPGNAKKQYNKPVSYGNRGMILEDMINNSNQYYLDRDIAVIYKKPTPIQIVDTKIDTKGKMITKAFFKEPSTLDYNGLYKGKYIDFDAKETQNKTAFPLQNIHEHQIKHMVNILNHGGISFLIIYINNEYYLLNGPDIVAFINNNDRKSIPLSYIEEKGYIIPKKLNPCLDYLNIIDNLYFKEDV